MERTESKILQIAPAHENDLIQDMQKFGYNVQNRQEIHEEGGSLTLPNLYGGATTRTKIKHYVKIHFVRSLETKNLDQIRNLEERYFGTKLPPVKKWPMIVSSILVLGALNALIFHGNIVVFLVSGIPGGAWLYKSLQNRKAAQKLLAEVQKERRELIERATALL